MEFIDGILLTEIDKLKNQGYDLRKISTIIALTFTNQIFKDGFVHSDPHQVYKIYIYIKHYIG